MQLDCAGVVLHGVSGYCASTRSCSIFKHLMAYCLGVNVRSLAVTRFPNILASSACFGFFIASSLSRRLLSTGSTSLDARFLLPGLFFGDMCTSCTLKEENITLIYTIFKINHLSSILGSSSSASPSHQQNNLQ